MKKKAIYPGTFDPITYGHLDIIQRSAEMVDELIVGVLTNKGKSPLFTPEERVEMIKDAVKDIPNVKVLAFDGLLIEFAKKQKATIIIRGLRVPKWFAILYTTILFVISHPLMWGVFSYANKSYHLYIYLSVAGIVWAITYLKTKSLRFVILSHFIVDMGNMSVLTFLNIYLPPTM